MTEASGPEGFLRTFHRISGLGAEPDGRGFSRLAASAQDALARAAFGDWMVQQGARIAVDAAGNQFACFDWAGPDAEWVFSGSHLDTQPRGGRFDGALGVVAAGAAAIRLAAQGAAGGLRPRRNLAVVNWTNEEGARFQPSLTGSSVFAGAVPVAEALTLRDPDGTTLAEALAASGIVVGQGQVPPRPVACVELHVEQGIRLEEAGRGIGLVQATWAARKFTAEWTGRSSHTGPTPMPLRRDALLAAARGIAAFEDALAARWPDLHRSSARIAVSPNSPNMVPDSVTVWFELRGPDPAVLQAAGDAVIGHIADLARAADIGFHLGADATRPPSHMDPGLFALVAEVAGGLGHAPLVMASVAGHDVVALQNGGIPSALIFVPSRGGIGHHPDEHTDDAQMVAGLEVLTAILRRLVAPDTPDVERKA